MITFVNFGKHGRLGNQLFQYSMLRGVALKNNCALKLPNVNQSDLKYFQLTCDELTNQHLQHINNNFIDEPTYHFLPDVFEQKDGTNFHGYFQSEKYFKHCEDQIRQDLIFKKYISDSAEYEIQKYRGKNPLVSIHVRHGDYLTVHDGLFHTPCSRKYYQGSMETFENTDFLFFSDDIPWCKDNFTGPNIKYSENNPPIIDFAMITLCDHHILSNSSFGWWGAWLNKNVEKRIIAPTSWFGPLGPQDTYDLIPDEWELR